MNLINKISNWLFGKKDSLSKECEHVYDKLEQKYNSKEKITDSHLTKEEYLNSLSDKKKQILVDSVDQIEHEIDKDQWKTYLKRSKRIGEETKLVDPSVDTNQPDAIDINSPSAGNDYLLSVEPAPLLKVIDSVKFENYKKETNTAKEYVSKSVVVKGEEKPLELDDSRIVNVGHLKHTLTVEKGIVTDVKSETTDDQIIIMSKPLEINTEKAKTIKQNKKRKYNKKK